MPSETKDKDHDSTYTVSRTGTFTDEACRGAGCLLTHTRCCFWGVKTLYNQSVEPTAEYCEHTQHH